MNITMLRSGLVAFVGVLIGLSSPAGWSAAFAGDEPACEPIFTPLSQFPAGPNFGMNAVADFDGDGNLDLTVGTVFHIGDGSGGFVRTQEIQAPWPTLFDMALADFDGDGIVDAVGAGFAGQEVAFFYGKRGGETFFEKAVPVPTAAASDSVWHLTTADFNVDGRPDVFAVSIGDPNQAVIINLGNREYRVTRVPVGLPGHMLASGDFNGDGNPDVAMGARSDIRFLAGRGDGTFAPAVRGILQRGARRFTGHRFRAADIDGDGRSDLVATADSEVLVFLGKDFGSAESPRFPSAPGVFLATTGATRFVEILDLNADGTLDIATMSAAGESEYRIFAGIPGSSPPQFDPGKTEATGLDAGSVLGVGDLNGDGSPDMVFTSEGSGQGRVFLNSGNCVPQDLVDLGDVNRDMLTDLSDGVAILSHLFLGGNLACPGAADLDGTVGLNLTDAVYLLNYLFLGGDPLVGEEMVPCE